MRDLAIAYGNNRQAKKWVNKTTKYEDLKERLKVTIRTTESAEEYAKMNKAQRVAAKDHGGFVGGVLAGDRRKVDTVETRSMIALDGDRIDTNFLDNYETNQGVFKDRLLSRYKRCCLCNISNKDFLIASHIKPWSKSEYDERLDVDNGLLLCPNHDKLFDRGYITFDDNGQIIISEKLDKLNRLFMNITPEMTIELTTGNKKYLMYHRKNVYNAKQNRIDFL